MKIKRILFLLLAAMQLTAPLYIAWRWEDVLATGVLYRFQTQPIDPADALRGRYLRLGFTEHRGPADMDVKWGTEAYAYVRTDALGFAEVYRVSGIKPEDGQFVTVRVGNIKENEAYFTLPFSRYYVNEAQADVLEKKYTEQVPNAVAEVRVKDGYGVLENIIGL